MRFFKIKSPYEFIFCFLFKWNKKKSFQCKIILYMNVKNLERAINKTLRQFVTISF